MIEIVPGARTEEGEGGGGKGKKPWQISDDSQSCVQEACVKREKQKELSQKDYSLQIVAEQNCTSNKEKVIKFSSQTSCVTHRTYPAVLSCRQR